MEKSDYYRGIQSLLDAASILDEADLVNKPSKTSSEKYLKTQIITYMGNKRKILNTLTR